MVNNLILFYIPVTLKCTVYSIVQNPKPMWLTQFSKHTINMMDGTTEKANFIDNAFWGKSKINQKITQLPKLLILFGCQQCFKIMLALHYRILAALGETADIQGWCSSEEKSSLWWISAQIKLYGCLWVAIALHLEIDVAVAVEFFECKCLALLGYVKVDLQGAFYQGEL